MIKDSTTVIVRKLNAKDDFRRVAELIYYTDDYIFPYLFAGDVKKGAEVMGRMVNADTVYNYRNVTAALLDDRIIGIVIALKKPFAVDLKSMADCFLNAGEIVDEKFAKVFNEYYNLFDCTSEGVYIANVCVDKKYRGMGVAGKMLDAVLQDDGVYELETVKANDAALRLYLSRGFEIEYEYPGFTAVPCYKMKREKRKGEK